MAELSQVIMLAVGITVGFLSIGLNLMLFATNPILKVKVMRYLQSSRAWGYWVLVQPGKQVVIKAVPFVNKEGAFIMQDGKAVNAENLKRFPVADEDVIYSHGRAPFQVNNAKDTNALSLEVPDPNKSIRDPGKLEAFMALYTAQADARARRKQKFDPQRFMMILLAVAALVAVAVYYGYANHDLLTQIAPLAQGARDNPTGLLAGVINGGGS